MKQLFFAVLLLAILGIGGFVYRSSLEAPLHGTNATDSKGSSPVACQADAKVCPDGSSIGRTGPSCDFAACPLPNIEIPSAGVSFVLPAGYRADEHALGADTSLIGAFEKAQLTGSSTLPDSIIVRRYPIPEGKDANSVMLAKTTYESSGAQPKSMLEFKPVIINGKTYQMIVVERFEAMVHVEYYLPRERDVLRFEAVQQNVSNWSDASLNVRMLSSVAALETLLGTLRSNEPGA